LFKNNVILLYYVLRIHLRILNFTIDARLSFLYNLEKGARMNNNFPLRLQIVMDKANISQSELAKRTGLSKPLISQYLSGKFSPKYDKVVILAKSLNTSASYLLNWDNQEVLGNRVKLQRKRMEIDSEQLAYELGHKSVDFITELESTDMNMPSSEIHSLAIELNTTADYLTGLVDDPRDYAREVSKDRIAIPHDFVPDLEYFERCKLYIKLKETEGKYRLEESQEYYGQEQIKKITNEYINSFNNATDALKFILEHPIFASNVGYDPKRMTDEQLIKLANKILKFTKMEIEDLEEIVPEDI